MRFCRTLVMTYVHGPSRSHIIAPTTSREVQVGRSTARCRNPQAFNNRYRHTPASLACSQSPTLLHMDHTEPRACIFGGAPGLEPRHACSATQPAATTRTSHVLAVTAGRHHMHDTHTRARTRTHSNKNENTDVLVPARAGGARTRTDPTTRHTATTPSEALRIPI